MAQIIFQMFSKNALSERDSEQPKKRLRSNLSDLYLSGTISGLRAATLFTDASVAGAANTADLADRESKNGQRDLRRKLLKNSKWPPLQEDEVEQTPSFLWPQMFWSSLWPNSWCLNGLWARKKRGWLLTSFLWMVFSIPSRSS